MYPLERVTSESSSSPSLRGPEYRGWVWESLSGMFSAAVVDAYYFLCVWLFSLILIFLLELTLALGVQYNAQTIT